MAKVFKWGLVTFIWLFALGCAYVGLIFFVLGPIISARGDIDYVDFTEAEKHRANIQAVFLQGVGLIILVVAGLSLICSTRFADFLKGKIFKADPEH